MLDKVLDNGKENSVDSRDGGSLPTLAQVEKWPVIKGPGREKKSFLRMLKRESVEYIIDIFYERRKLNKKSFLEIVASTMKGQTPEEKEIASRYFDSIDLEE